MKYDDAELKAFSWSNQAPEFETWYGEETRRLVARAYVAQLEWWIRMFCRNEKETAQPAWDESRDLAQALTMSIQRDYESLPRRTRRTLEKRWEEKRTK